MENDRVCKVCSKIFSSNEYSFEGVCSECITETGNCLTIECDICRRIYPVQNGDLEYDGLYCETCDRRVCGDCNIHGGDDSEKYICEKCPRVICRECDVSGLCGVCDKL